MGTADKDLWGKRRIEVWRIGLVAGLLALIALAATGCGAATPAQMAPSVDPEPTSGAGDATPARN